MGITEFVDEDNIIKESAEVNRHAAFKTDTSYFKYKFDGMQ